MHWMANESDMLYLWICSNPACGFRKVTWTTTFEEIWTLAGWWFCRVLSTFPLFFILKLLGIMKLFDNQLLAPEEGPLLEAEGQILRFRDFFPLEMADNVLQILESLPEDWIWSEWAVCRKEKFCFNLKQHEPASCFLVPGGMGTEPPSRWQRSCQPSFLVWAPMSHKSGQKSVRELWDVLKID